MNSKSCPAFPSLPCGELVRHFKLRHPLYQRLTGEECRKIVGDVDGIGAEVRLQHCLGVEFAHNYLWVADTYNHKIKLVNPFEGNCQTVLGDGISGLKDGQAQSSRFSEPSGLSIMGSYLYVADTNNHAIRRVELDTLTVTTMQFPGLCAPDVCIPAST